MALARATRSGRRAIDDLAADHGRDNTRLANGLERYRKDILRQDGEIRQLARFQCADPRVGKGCEGRTLRIGVNRVGHGDSLLRKVYRTGNDGTALTCSI